MRCMSLPPTCTMTLSPKLLRAAIDGTDRRRGASRFGTGFEAQNCTLGSGTEVQWQPT